LSLGFNYTKYCVRFNHRKSVIYILSVVSPRYHFFWKKKEKKRIDSILNKILRQTFKAVVDDPIRQLREIGLYDPPVTSTTHISYHWFTSCTGILSYVNDVRPIIRLKKLRYWHVKVIINIHFDRCLICLQTAGLTPEIRHKILTFLSSSQAEPQHKFAALVRYLES